MSSDSVVSSHIATSKTDHEDSGTVQHELPLDRKRTHEDEVINDPEQLSSSKTKKAKCEDKGNAFIVYAKEDNDPEGDQVLELNNLLRKNGINSDIDLFYKNDTAISDWTSWVKTKITDCLKNVKSHIIVVCSPKLFCLLEQTTYTANTYIEMVAGYIDSYTLKFYLENHVEKFLPIVLNSTSKDCVPLTLTRKTTYFFPYHKLTENATEEDILSDPDFLSFKNLLRTLTGQPEHYGQAPASPGPKLEGNNGQYNFTTVSQNTKDIPTTLTESVAADKLSNKICNLNCQGQLPPDEKIWPPYSYLPKVYTPVLLLQHKEVKHHTTAVAQVCHYGYTDETVSDGPVPKKPSFYYTDEIPNTSKITNKIDEMLSIFESSEPQFMYVEGAPGIGKTFLIQEIARKWGKGEVLKHFKLVLIVRLRESTSRSFETFEEFLQSFFPGENVTDEITLCSKYLSAKSGEEVLFLIDGFDEMPHEDMLSNSFVTNILTRRSLPCCGILLSSRPSAAKVITDNYTPTNIVNILGFNEQQRIDYIKNVLQDSKDIQKITNYFQTHFTISNLCFIPFNLAVLLYLYKQRKDLPESIYGLYNYCVCCTVHRYLRRNTGYTNEDVVTDLEKLPDTYKKIINQLAKLAMDMLLADKIIFTDEDIKSTCPDIKEYADGFGLLQTMEKYNEVGKTCTYNFIHFSIQEYLAAHYIAHLPPDEALMAFEQQFLKALHFNMFAIYVAYTKGQQQSFKKYLSDGDSTVGISEKFLHNQHKCIRLFQCFLELKDKEMCNSIAKAETFKNSSIKLQNILAFSDVECLTTFILHSFQKDWKLVELKGCCIRDHGVRVLHHGLEHCDKNIIHLNLADNQISSLSSKFVSEITIRGHIKELSIIGNRTIGDNEDLYTMLVDPHSVLETLHMSRTKLTSSAAIKLFAVLEKATKLKGLWVSYNNIGDDAFPAIAKSLEINKSLVKLRIRSNPFSAKSAQYIIDAITQRSSLEELWLPKYTEEIHRKWNLHRDAVNEERKSKGYKKLLDMKYYK